MRQRVALEIEGRDDLAVVFDGRDVWAWETRHRRSALKEPTSVSMLSWLGWHAASRQGLLDDTWEVFDGVCVGVVSVPDEHDEEEKEERPTRAATRTGRGAASSAA